MGRSDLWTRFTDIVFSRLWTAPGARQRWAMRFRTEKQVRKIAEDIGWTVATDLGNIVPIHELAIVLERAVLDEIATGLDMHRRSRDSGMDEGTYFGVLPQVTKMLDWLIRHEPVVGQQVIADITGEAERRFELPRHIIENTIETALSLDGSLDHETLDEYLARALPTAK